MSDKELLEKIQISQIMLFKEICDLRSRFNMRDQPRIAQAMSGSMNDAATFDRINELFEKHLSEFKEKFLK